MIWRDGYRDELPAGRATDVVGFSHLGEALAPARLATALAHSVAHLVITLAGPDGESVAVSGCERAPRDVGACELRAALGSAARGTSLPPWLRYLHGPIEVSAEGVGVRHAGDGVVSVEGAGGRWWATQLGPERVVMVLADAAVEVLGCAEVPVEVVERAEASVHVDAHLGVSVVHLRCESGSVAHERRCDELARRLARACAVAELLRELDGGHPG